MVKNTNGGSGHKRQARYRGAQNDYKITSELEVEAYVEKIIGNGRLLVNSIDGRYTGLICTIRGKFSGRNKSRNKIDTNSIVIIGLREWEEPTYKTCDLLSVTKHIFVVVDKDEHVSRDDIIVFSNNEDSNFIGDDEKDDDEKDDDQKDDLLYNNIDIKDIDKHKHNQIINHDDIDFDDI